jgi:hypothetical protein
MRVACAPSTRSSWRNQLGPACILVSYAAGKNSNAYCGIELSCGNLKELPAGVISVDGFIRALSLDAFTGREIGSFALMVFLTIFVAILISEIAVQRLRRNS